MCMNIDEVDVGKIKIGQEAEIVADAYPDEKFVGKVLRINPLAKVEQNVTRFPVVIEAPNPNFRLLAGMNATVTVTVYDNPNALVVPVEALKEAKDLGGDLAERGAMRLGERGAFRGNAPDSVREQRRKRFQERLAAGDSSAMRWSEERAKAKRRFVMLKDSTGAVAPRPVLIGEQTAEYAEVLRGLNEGDEVEITLFSRALMEGQQFQERMRQRGLWTTLARTAPRIATKLGRSEQLLFFQLFSLAIPSASAVFSNALRFGATSLNLPPLKF